MKPEFRDSYATLKIHLNNLETIKGKELRIRISPVTNPPSTKPVTGFVVYTALAPKGVEYYTGIEGC